MARRPWWHYALGVVVVAYLLYGVAGAVVMATGLNAVALLALQLAGLGCAFAAFKRVGNPVVLLGVTTVAGILGQLLAEYGGSTLLFLVVWLAPFRLRMPYVLACTAVVIAGFLWASKYTAIPASAVGGIAAGLAWAAFLSGVLNQMAVTRSLAGARAGEAVLAERQRLAREIHDVLAHSLSGQVVHLEGTRLLLERGCDPAVVLERVIRAGDLARAGLEEAKRAVEALRGTQPPLADQLEALAEEFRAVTGTSCSLVVSDGPSRLTPEAELTVVRTAQEALTNVRKHAPHASVTLVLNHSESWCELEVRDTGGDVGGQGATGNGYGLVGMRERAELLGGDLEAGSHEDGFRVHLRVPA